MLFNSFIFLWFFAVVYTGYLLLRRNHRAQNLILLIASFVFYGYWDWRFLGLLVLSALIDYVAGGALYRSRSPRARRWLLAVSMCSNLGILGFFKYWNFFAASAARALGAFGLHPDFVTLNVVLPLGISFYTFQSMTYAIDIYRGQLKPAGNVWDYLLYVSLFPQLVAGPIERASGPGRKWSAEATTPTEPVSSVKGITAPGARLPGNDTPSSGERGRS